MDPVPADEAPKEESPDEGVDGAQEGSTEQSAEAPPVPAGEELPPGMLWGGLALLLLVVVGLAFGFVRRGRTPDLIADEDGAEAEVTAAPAPALAAPAPVGLVDRLRERMGKTRAALQGRLDELFGRVADHEALLEELEEVLLVADVGVATTARLIEALRAALRSGTTEPDALRSVLRTEMARVLDEVSAPLGPLPASRPWVILVVGVNGSGKTTTIGKLAARLRRDGKKVLLAAGDTFRAAAGEQLAIWAKRADVEIVRQPEGADPGAVVYQALDAALASDVDVVIVDTAGRLQTRRPLMEQLQKVRRVIDRKVPGAPHETLLVLDGTMGQNALSQAERFHEATPLTGVVVTKLDGTARGGMILTVAAEMKLPVKLIGIGEQMDLRDFEAAAFVDALA